MLLRIAYIHFNKYGLIKNIQLVKHLKIKTTSFFFSKYLYKMKENISVF